MNKKIMIIGLDGGSWKVFDPLIDAGHMPNLKKLKAQGCWGQLRSTEPPVTPTAWTTMITGVNPNKHGVYGFEHYNPITGQVRLTNSTSIQFKTMWEHLSQHHYQVASLNVPQTYPPFKVNGVVVSGYGCPGKQFDYTYPPELKDLINQQAPDYDMILHWKKGDLDDLELLKTNMAYCIKAFDAIVQLAELVEQQYGWNVMLAEIQQMDLIQHHIYGYLSPDFHRQNPDVAAPVIDMIQHLDTVIGRLAGMAPGGDDLVMIASDHGLAPFHAKLKPNNLLKQWGYLKPTGSLRRITKNIRRLIGIKNKTSADIAEKLAFDLNKTQAYVAHAAQHAYLYINNDLINTPQDKDNLINDLKNKFLEVANPITKQNVFAGAERPEDLFKISKEQASTIADLILIAEQGYLPVRTMHGGDIFEHANHPHGGSHSYDGMYLIAGKNIRRGTRFDANIADIAPTVYAAMAIEMPHNLDGKPIQPAFETPLAIKTQSSTTNSPPVDKQSPKPLQQDEEQIVQQRLADLGYLE